MLSSAIVFSVVMVTSIVMHRLADYVTGQWDYVAEHKALPGSKGWTSILIHVIAYHITLVIGLAMTLQLLDLPVTVLGFTLGILFSAVTHAILDRRWPVRWLLEHTGKKNFAKMQTPVCGIIEADQSLHYFCLWISALLMAVL
jgi:hypothetical protein